MPVNIIEAIQTNLGYPHLNKIDPNTQEEKENSNNPIHTLAQAAITAVVIGFYRYAGEKNLEAFQNNENEFIDWLDELFGTKKMEVVEKVAQYGNVSAIEAEGEMKKIADETFRIIISETDSKNIDAYLKSQRSNILTYLPEALHMGDILGDNTIDDRTNKMEGPISNLVHAIEKTFSDKEVGKGAIEETFHPSKKKDD